MVSEKLKNIVVNKPSLNDVIFTKPTQIPVVQKQILPTIKKTHKNIKRMNWILPTNKNMKKVIEEEKLTLQNIHSIPYNNLRRILIRRKLIKETSKAPHDILRQIALGIII
jgi:alpha-L-fucosidase